MRTYPILKAASARPGCSWWAFLASSIASKTQKGVSLFYLRISTLKKQKAIYSLKESYNQVRKKKIYIYIYYIYIYLYTVGTESIQTPLHFSLFVILQPYAKII